jgi:hypothetical protein
LDTVNKVYTCPEMHFGASFICFTAFLLVFCSILAYFEHF